ncbi:MAG: DNA-directed DNA polymerase II small subunit [Thermoplasmatota archaeon]
MRETVLKKLAERNTLLSPDAMDYLDEQEDPHSIVNRMVESDEELPFPLGKETLVSFVENDISSGTETVRNTEEAVLANMEILNDITGNSTCTGELDDFTKYFSDRYRKLRGIITKRREATGVMDIARIKKRKGEGKIIGMVGDIHTTNNGNKVLKLEDETGKIKGFISSDSKAFETNILEDEVILAKGSVWKQNKKYDVTFAIDEIIQPGVPKLQKSHSHDFTGRIAFMGDIHLGSETFLEDKWNDFVSWLNSDDQMAKEIKYLVVSGDLVDGIGVYPNQEDELVINDIYEQYRELAEMLREIPDRINIITIPGNHDIVRNPEPQPSLPEDVQGFFADNVHFYSNPTVLDICGLKILCYHGKSINDLSDILPQVNNENPDTAMIEMLERRHLASVYGRGTPIAPESEDHLVIEDVPDIFVTGHIHRSKVNNYHSTILINSSTWQDQTEYQKMRDIRPEPARVVIVEPSTRKVTIQDFS